MNEQAQIFPPRQLFVGGGWHEGASGARRDVVDPADGHFLTTVAEADATEDARSLAREFAMMVEELRG